MPNSKFEKDKVASSNLIQHLLIVFIAVLIQGFVLLWLSMGSSPKFDFFLYSFICVFAPLISAVLLLLFQNNKSLNFPIFILGCMILASSTSISFIFVSIFNFLEIFSLTTLFGYQLIFVGAVCIFQLLLLFLKSSAKTQSDAILFDIKLRRSQYFRPINVIILVICALMFSSNLNAKLPFVGQAFYAFYELNPRPSVLVMLLSFSAACIILYAALRTNGVHRLSKKAVQKSYEVKLLAITLLIIPLFYLDVRFDSDLLHFLTIASPTNQLMRAGGVPLVDTYSQYGLGPLLINWLVFKWFGSNLHLTNLLAQINSIGLYCIITVCIWRTSSFVRSSMVLGVASISIVIAGWYYGNYSINSVPSSMGLRYLPCGLIVLAIALLEPCRDNSAFIKLSLFIATVWSIDALFGSYIIVALWIALESWAFGSISYFTKRLVKTILLPFTFALVFICSLTLFLSGHLPDLRPVFEFIIVYNFTSEFWSIKASNVFWGWVWIAAIYGCALSYCWYLAIDFRKNYRLSENSDRLKIDTLNALRSYAPLSGLIALMSAYFVGRSVDFTLTIALLPVLGLVVPAFLKFSEIARAKNEVLLHNLLVGFFVLLLTFSFSVLFRDGGPYKPIFSEILRGRFYESFDNFKLRPMLDKNANPNFEDFSGLAKIAITAIDKFAPYEERITLLLGMHPTTPWSVHTDMVYLLTNKANTFPISYVLTDQLSPTRLKNITNFDPHLQMGDIIIVRRDKTKLQDLEITIWNKLLQLYRLEQLNYDNNLIDVYQVASSNLKPETRALTR